MRVVSSADVVRMLRDGQVVRDVRVDEPFVLREHYDDEEACPFAVRFVDCEFDTVDLMSTVHNDHAVSFVGCRFESLSLGSCFFHSGLVIERCQVARATYIDCGGHNDRGEVRLVDNHFRGFVYFDDEYFEGPVRIERCRFERGSNLFGLRGPIEPRFAVAPVLVDNIGALDVELIGA